MLGLQKLIINQFAEEVEPHLFSDLDFNSVVFGSDEFVVVFFALERLLVVVPESGARYQ